MRNLYYLHRDGQLELVGVAPTNEKSVYEIANNFIATIYPNFKIYYYRTWDETPNEMWIDYGSHDEFFIWKGKEV